MIFKIFNITLFDNEIKSLEKYIQKDFKDFTLNDWRYALATRKISEELMGIYMDCMDWNIVSSRQKLSEGFIRKHKELLNWDLISINQKMSEKFMIEFKDDINWKFIELSR